MLAYTLMLSKPDSPVNYAKLLNLKVRVNYINQNFALVCKFGMLLRYPYMGKTIKIGILRETRNPPDRRVPLTPHQVITLEELYPFIEFFIQPSDYRSIQMKNMNISIFLERRSA